MARGGKIGYRRRTRNKLRLEKKGSDGSDEDYTLDEDEEFVESEDDYCSSLADDESEESLVEFEDEEDEEEWVEKKVKSKKVGRQTRRNGIQTRRKNELAKPKRKKVANSQKEEDCNDYYFSGAKKRKKSEVSHKEEEDEDIGIMCTQDEVHDDENPRKKFRLSRQEYVDSHSEDPKERDKVSYREVKEDKEVDEYDESDDSDDEEFTPGEVLRSTRRKPVKKWGLRTKNRSNIPKESRDENPATRKKKTIKEWRWGRRKKVTVNSDSDFVSSESSDYEYTISEEEREQIREASEFCRRLTTSLRSSSSSKTLKEEQLVPPKRKRPERKGKQKVVDLKIEIGKQVCGICLSEEGKRTVRGVLNCCSHYFCFACIMEWSKVESRCPLCKQRFTTISRAASADGGHGSRDAVFPVPERDQVYQPSEEELRGYLDPYENFHCTECQQGGDDELMLLCDLCDSPAHTYCVGLGREVPDGNWYCDGCRPTALASTNAQGLNPDQGASNNLSVGSSPVSCVRETFDLNEAYVPETPLSQMSGHSQSPRHPIGAHLQPTSPGLGSGAFTLYDRRRIQRQIHQLLNNRSRQSDRGDGVAPASSVNLFGSPIGRGVITNQTTQNSVIPSRMVPQNVYLQGRLADYNTPSLYNRDAFSARLSSLSEEALHTEASTSNGHAFGGLSRSEFGGLNAGMGHQQHHPCSAASNGGAAASTLPFQFPEATTLPSRTLQGSLHTPF